MLIGVSDINGVPDINLHSTGVSWAIKSRCGRSPTIAILSTGRGQRLAIKPIPNLVGAAYLTRPRRGRTPRHIKPIPRIAVLNMSGLF